MSRLPKQFKVFPGNEEERRLDREVILLLHGAGGDTYDWISPIYRQYNFTYWKKPKDRVVRRGAITTPNIPVPSLVPTLSHRYPVHNWKDFLTNLGHTVITYSQEGNTQRVEVPLKELKESVIPYIKKNILKGNLKNSKVTVIAHSRGGLLISKYLHDVPNSESSSWLKKVITIQSPHRGTQLPKLDNYSKIETALRALTGDLTSVAMSVLRSYFIDGQVTECHKELTPDSELIKSLNPDVSPNPSIEFFTIGGTSTQLFRVYNWIWKGTSFIPNGIYTTASLLTGAPIHKFDWVATPVENILMSPLLNKLPDLPSFDELKDGKGDILVSDKSARLGYSKHKTLHISHAEGLWHPDLLEYVSELLGTKAKPKPAKDIKYFVNTRTKQFHDLTKSSYRCNIDRVKYGALVDVDNGDEVKEMGFDGCCYCCKEYHTGKEKNK